MDKRPIDEKILKELENALLHVGGVEKESILFRIKVLKRKTSTEIENLDFVQVPRMMIEHKIKKEKNVVSGYQKLMATDQSLKTSLSPKYEYAMAKLYFLDKQSKAQECMGEKTGIGEKTSGTINFTIVDYECDPIFETQTIDFFVDLSLQQSVKPRRGMKIVIDLTNNCEIEIVVKAKSGEIIGMLFYPCECFLDLKDSSVYMMDFQTYAMLLVKATLAKKRKLVRKNAEIFAKFKVGHELVAYHTLAPSYCCVCDRVKIPFFDMYRCTTCKFTLHKKCADYILFKCKMGKEKQENEGFVRKYNIPHKLEHVVSSGVRYCGHCGERIKSNKKAYRCTMCSKNFHNACEICIFPSCGIELEFRMAVAQFKPLPAFVESGKATVSINDFSLVNVLGRGSFGKVMLGKYKGHEKIVALKILKKEVVVNANTVPFLEIERYVLEMVSSFKHPFLMQMEYCFQDRYNVYFGTEYLAGGDLFHHITNTRFSDSQNKLWISEMVLGIEFLHAKKIVHRDLKLDNIMLTADGHVKIVDFGLCKNNMDPFFETFTFCGTIVTIAPEIVKEKGYTKDVDWWSLGVIIFEMHEAEPPFNGATTKEIITLIINEEPKFKRKDTPEIVQDLVMRLLKKDPTERLGRGEADAKDVKSHPYFKDTDWDAITNKKVVSEFQPGDDLSNFDEDFTQDPVVITKTNTVSADEKFFVNFH
jgi:hypothetical protein